MNKENGQACPSDGCEGRTWWWKDDVKVGARSTSPPCVSVSDLPTDLERPIENGYEFWGRQFVRRSYGCAAIRAYRRFQMAVSTPVAANADREE